jgi:hypothetical protein
VQEIVLWPCDESVIAYISFDCEETYCDVGAGTEFSVAGRRACSCGGDSLRLFSIRSDSVFRMWGRTETLWLIPEQDHVDDMYRPLWRNLAHAVRYCRRSDDEWVHLIIHGHGEKTPQVAVEM